MTDLSLPSPTRTFNLEPFHINSSHRVLRHILSPLLVQSSEHHKREGSSHRLLRSDALSVKVLTKICIPPRLLWSSLCSATMLTQQQCGLIFWTRSALARVLWCLTAFSIAWATHGLPFIDGAGVPWELTWTHQLRDAPPKQGGGDIREPTLCAWCCRHSREWHHACCTTTHTLGRAHVA